MRTLTRDCNLNYFQLRFSSHGNAEYRALRIFDAKNIVRLDKCEGAEDHSSRMDEARGKCLMLYHPRRSTTTLTASFSRVDSFWIVMLLTGAAVSTAAIFTARLVADEVVEIEVLGTKHGHWSKISDESVEQRVIFRRKLAGLKRRTKFLVLNRGGFTGNAARGA